MQPITKCNGKVIYDKRGAQTAKNARRRDAHALLRIYHCPWCNGWHLTHVDPYSRENKYNA